MFYDVDVSRGQDVVQMVLDAVDMANVAHAVRHAGHGRRHYAVVYLVLQPCTPITMRYDTIRDAILTRARTPTRVSLIYRTD